jgi:sec-independent protein translocase protein TatA
MGSFSIWHWLIVLLVVMVLFGGRGKISSLMGDFAEGIKAFKKGMAEDKTADAKSEPVKTIDAGAAPTRHRKRFCTGRARAQCGGEKAGRGQRVSQRR